MSPGAAHGPAVTRRSFVRTAVGSTVALGGIGALAACSDRASPDAAGRRPQPTRAPATTTIPPTLPPTTTTTLEPRLTQPLPPLIRSGPADRPVVAVTIDDIFGAGGADQLWAALDLARDRNVKLTFFPTGGALEAHMGAGKQDVWKRAVLEGHEIGNHTYTHRALTSLPDQEIRDELTWTQHLLDEALGFPYRMRLMRPPGGTGGAGNGDPRLMGILTELGLTMAMWTIDSNYTTGNASYLSKILGQVRNGSIVLCHFQTFGLPSLAALLDALPPRGLEPVTVTQMFT